MLEKIPFTPRHPPTDQNAEKFIPKFLYRDPESTEILPEIREEFFGARRKLRIGVVGAGISCLQFLHDIEENIPIESVEIVVFEREKDVGGVWLTHTYPGCKCDSPGYVALFIWLLCYTADVLS